MREEKRTEKKRTEEKRTDIRTDISTEGGRSRRRVPFEVIRASDFQRDAGARVRHCAPAAYLAVLVAALVAVEGHDDHLHADGRVGGRECKQGVSLSE